MDIATVTGLIGSLGFPIAACFVLFWYLNKERESHAGEIDDLKNVIDENNKILSALKTIIESLERRIS